MKKSIFEYQVPGVQGFPQSPTLKSLTLQSDGSLWGGFLFSSDPLQSFVWNPEDGTISSVNSGEISKITGDDSIGIWAGLKPSVTGDTAFVSWHKSGVPAFMNFFGEDLKKADQNLIEKLLLNDAGASTIRHSIVERNSGSWQVRRSKEPGVVIDVSIIGDYVFGISPKSVFREPYLKTEKREVLRSDLHGNRQICRDAAGNFWFLSQNERLLRMGLTDLKPKLTPLKIENSDFGPSDSSALDGWMYVLCQSGKKLVRIRMNPVTNEEELQVVSEFEGVATALHVLDHANSAKLIVCESLEGRGSRVFGYDLVAAEDPEEMGDVPNYETLTSLDGLVRVSAIASKVLNLSGENPKSIVWLGSGLSPGQPASQETHKIVTLTDV